MLCRISAVVVAAAATLVVAPAAFAQTAAIR
jgi:hypothetical protein